MFIQLYIVLFLLAASTSCDSPQSNIKTLSSSNFDQVHSGIWLILFHTQQCPDCQQVALQYQKASIILKDLVQVGAFDVDNQKTVIKISSFHAIKLFNQGQIINYQGKITVQKIIEFVLNQFKEITNERMQTLLSSQEVQNNESPEFQMSQLVNQEIFEQKCKKDNYCVIAFLNHYKVIGHTQLKILRDEIEEVGRSFIGKPFNFVWQISGVQFDLMEKLGVGQDPSLPLIIVINYQKRVSAKMRGIYTMEAMEQFLNKVLANKVKMNKFSQLQPLCEGNPYQPPNADGTEVPKITTSNINYDQKVFPQASFPQPPPDNTDL